MKDDYLTEVKEKNGSLYEDLVTAQEKAKLYLRIVIGIIVGFSLIMLAVLLFSFGKGGILGWLVFLLCLSLATLRIKIVPQMTRLIVEVLGNYYCVWGPGIHIFVRGLMRIASEVSLKEQAVSLFPDGEKLDVEQAQIGVVATATIRALNPILITYSFAGDEVESGPAKIKKLIRMKVQDAVQTLIKKKGMSYDDVISLKGNDVKNELWKNVEGLKETFENWGTELLKTLFEDFEPQEEEANFRREVFRIDRQREIAKKEVEIKQLEGKGDAEKIIAVIWNLAKIEAGVRKEDDELTQEDIKQILKYFEVARSTYLKDRSIGAIKPTDKVIVAGLEELLQKFLARTTTEKK